MKNVILKIKNWWAAHAPTKRRLIQLYSALLFNSYLKGYITGDIFKGMSKNLCTPGLNCYSCPGAVTSCPLGALQNSFSSSGKTAPYYMLGIIMLYGIIFGRWICGWLCPFGLIQDLLHKIKTPKLKKSRFTRVLSFFKYVLLVLFVVVLPLIYMLHDFPLPAFCKYICPAGTIGGAIGLLINPGNEGMFGMLGPLFTWKFALAVSFVVGMIFVYRLFCRFICPLGALYGFFNKFSLFGITLDKSKCISCGKCISVCEMDIHHVGDHECISCGKCVGVCPTKAISYKGSKIILPDSEIESAKTEEEKAAVEVKREKRVKLASRITALVLSAVLLFSLVYLNFFYDDGTNIDPDQGVGDTDEDSGDTEDDNSIPTGSKIGNKCPSYDLELVNGSGTVNIKEFRGKIVIINFWGVWCGPCKQELPDFDDVANEYDGEVVVLTIHTVTNKASAPEYIQTHFPSSKMLFAYDVPLTSEKDMYFHLLGGKSAYPRTLVLDEKGVIQAIFDGKATHSQLIDSIEAIRSESADTQ
ncbi:MAG: 4Fe-4S binding protein [Clostridia bacterium]|nr:4Fe-4S binding protein [Clostridia bacterium]